MPCHMLHITAIKVQSIHHSMHIQRKCNYLYASFVTLKTAVSLPNHAIYQLFCSCSKHVLNEANIIEKSLQSSEKKIEHFNI